MRGRRNKREWRPVQVQTNYGAEFIKKRLLGLERVGIVPNEVMPFYCHSRFPGEDVDSFRHLNHENPDAEIALIEWQPIKPVKLKENAHE